MLDNVKYWFELCDDDLKVAKSLLKAKHFLWTGFMCHLVAEKALKAAIADATNEVPPKSHDLLKLVGKTDVCGDLPDDYKILLGKLTPLQIEARYPEYKEMFAALLTESYCNNLLAETEEFLCWMKEKLGK